MMLKGMMKKSVGIVLLILLTIILSRAKTFQFMMTTYLGRIILLSILIFMTCINKFLGVLFVLMIFTLYNTYSDQYMFVENFDNKNSKKVVETPKIHVVTNNDLDKNKKSESKNKNIAQEGFDLQSTEDTIKRSKQSNSITVEKRNNDSENVMPYEDKNTEGFSIF
jgi:energy-coupling factor transporter transmembrane protein EcfT